MRAIHAAISARVSSERQVETHTVASQLATWRERVAADGLSLPEALPCMDHG
jgi:hypothetical protein